MAKSGKKANHPKFSDREIRAYRQRHDPGAFESAITGQYLLAVSEHPISFNIRSPTSKRSYTVGRSFSCFRRPNTSLEIEFTNRSVSNIFVSFPEGWLEERFDEAGLRCSAMGDFVEVVDPVLLSIVDKMQQAYSRHGPNTLDYQTVSDALIWHLVGRHCTTRTGHAFLKPSRLRTLMAYIDEHLFEALSLDDMAAVAGVSRFEFARSFAQVTGVPPHRYVMLRRTEAAIAMIRSEPMQLAEIAAASGFYDQAHMSRWISREVSLTPNTLRKAEVSEIRL